MSNNTAILNNLRASQTHPDGFANLRVRRILLSISGGGKMKEELLTLTVVKVVCVVCVVVVCVE